MLFGGPCARPFLLYLAQYLQLVRFFLFSFSSHPLLVRLRALRDVVLFRLGGRVCVIGIRIGRGIGDFVPFLFHFVFAIPFLVWARCCLRLPRSVRFPRRSPIGMAGVPAVVEPAVEAGLFPG